jgi:Ala-tRNA(Pro) deacylase
MPASRDELFQRFADLGINTTTKSHAPVFTVEEARLVHPDIPGGYFRKNLLQG